MLFLFNNFWFQHFSFKHEPFHYLRFEKESKYFEFRVTQDLLGDWIIILNSGRVKSKLGQSRTKAFPSFNDALINLYILLEIRLKKWYQVKEYVIENLLFVLLLKSFLSNHLDTPPSLRTRVKRAKPISDTQEETASNVQQLLLFV